MVFKMDTPVLSSSADSVAVLANKAIRPGKVVIDAGAGEGLWTQAALAAVTGIEVHCFEPDLKKYRQLLLNLASAIATGQVIPHNAAVGWSRADGGAAWSSLQQYATFAGFNRLPFVRFGPGVPIVAATTGNQELIRHGHIEFIIATADSQQESDLAGVLLPHRYELFRHPALGDQVLCVTDRFRSTIKNERPKLPDLLQLCREFGIAPKGVVHVGAHEGRQARQYVDAGIAKSIMVEANPAVYAKLQDNTAGLQGVLAIHCAAGDQNGTAELRVANSDRSSSVFPFARHRAIFPTVKQTSLAEVPARTLDQILKETDQQPGDYNVLNLEIQGAELIALKGAASLLPNVQAVLAEVNYEELYAGGATIEQMDAFLESSGFDRVATTTPMHASWGSAFYVRRRAAPQPQQSTTEFLSNARNTLVNGWLSLSAASLREAWEGATGHAHRHLIANGVLQLPLATDDDHRVLDLLQKSLKSASKDRRLQLLLALMLYLPFERTGVSTDGLPGWLKKSLPSREIATAAMAA
jgi:FkbM family methyltransferase